MSLEPSQVRTVSTAKALPPKLEAKIKVPLSEAYLAELMAKEAEAVRSRFAKKWGKGALDCNGVEANAKRMAECSERQRELKAATVNILAKGPRSSAKLQGLLRATENMTITVLRALRDEGQVESIRDGRGAVWRLVGRKVEALESVNGVPPAPVALTVRGQEFPSLRACAKHFGVSVQAVANAVKRGSPDGIGSRKVEAVK